MVRLASLRAENEITLVSPGENFQRNNVPHSRVSRFPELTADAIEVVIRKRGTTQSSLRSSNSARPSSSRSRYPLPDRVYPDENRERDQWPIRDHSTIRPAVILPAPAALTYQNGQGHYESAGRKTIRYIGRHPSTGRLSHKSLSI